MVFLGARVARTCIAARGKESASLHISFKKPFSSFFFLLTLLLSSFFFFSLMSVDNVTVSLSRLALAKAIKTPDTDDAEPWTNSVIFHQAHIPTRMRERVENPQPAVQAQTSHRPLAHTHHHRQHHQQQLMRRSMIMERSSHDSRHSKIPDRNFKPSAGMVHKGRKKFFENLLMYKVGTHTSEVDRGSKSRVQHPAPSDDEDEEEEEEDSDDGSQDEDEQGDEIGMLRDQWPGAGKGMQKKKKRTDQSSRRETDRRTAHVHVTAT